MFIKHKENYNPRIDFQVVFFISRETKFGKDYSELKAIFDGCGSAATTQGREFEKLIRTYRILLQSGINEPSLLACANSLALEADAQTISCISKIFPIVNQKDPTYAATWLLREVLASDIFKDYSFEMAVFLFDATLAGGGYVPMVFQRSYVLFLAELSKKGTAIDSMHRMLSVTSDNSQKYIARYRKTSKEKIIKTILILKKEAKEKFGIAVVWLFGSFAKDKGTEFSDVDLFVGGGQPNWNPDIKAMASFFGKRFDRPADIHLDGGVWFGSVEAIKKERKLIYDDR
ncbi:MAG: nucleotidyltransferase domain-containing protein [Bacilli bacterium]|nr:nucleotidyltransferase domain-containing protein [Bacilli bacterium]